MGRIPPRMVRTIALFTEFCYIVRRHVLDDDDIEKLNTLLAQFHQEREIFREAGIRPDGFCLPRQHSLKHYANSVMKFGAPNGLCSSITESKHIKAVKKPWRRSSRFNALPQMLLTNQRLDKLAAITVDFRARGMLAHSIWDGYVDPPPPTVRQPQTTEDDEDEDGEMVDDRNIIGETKLAVHPSEHISWSTCGIHIVNTNKFLIFLGNWTLYPLGWASQICPGLSRDSSIVKNTPIQVQTQILYQLLHALSIMPESMSTPLPPLRTSPLVINQASEECSGNAYIRSPPGEMAHHAAIAFSLNTRRICQAFVAFTWHKSLLS